MIKLKTDATIYVNPIQIISINATKTGNTAIRLKEIKEPFYSNETPESFVSRIEKYLDGE